MLGGVALGWAMRGRLLRVSSVCTTWLIRLLLLLLGLEVGSDAHILSSLHTLGVEALLISLCATLGSCVAAYVLWASVSRHRPAEGSEGEAQGLHTDGAPEEGGSLWQAMRGSLVIVTFFLIGGLAGAFGLVPGRLVEDGRCSFYALCALMACVGIGIGSDRQTLHSFKSLDWRLAWLPVCTILGTLFGSFVATGFLHDRALGQCLAIGSGLGYYSLSSIFITEYHGAEAGTVALLANIIRELVTLLGAPFLLRGFGRLAPISAGGATTMDTTLPVILQTTGRQFVILSIYHGFATDFSVPFLVTLFCSL